MVIYEPATFKSGLACYVHIVLLRVLHVDNNYVSSLFNAVSNRQGFTEKTFGIILILENAVTLNDKF